MAKRQIQLRPIDIESQLVAAIIVTTLVVAIVYGMLEAGFPGAGLSRGATRSDSLADLLIFGNYILQFALVFFLRWRWPLITCSELRLIPNRFGYGQLFCEVIIRNMLVILTVVVFLISDVDIYLLRALGLKTPWMNYFILSLGCVAITLLNHASKLKLQHPCTDFRRLENRRNFIPWQRQAIAIGISAILMGILSYGIPVIIKLIGLDNRTVNILGRVFVFVATYMMYLLLINSRPRPTGEH